jgi:hypothetical protein
MPESSPSARCRCARADAAEENHVDSVARKLTRDDHEIAPNLPASAIDMSDITQMPSLEQALSLLAPIST